MSRFVYLHGFASGPASRKASFFQERLDRHGIALEIPDLAEGDFRHLTVTAQLRVIERLEQEHALALIGSSMGGYLAALYAAAHPTQVERMVLLAPAFNFYKRWAETLGPENFARWREQGEIPVFHYAGSARKAIGYQLMDDARAYPAYPDARPGLPDLPWNQGFRRADWFLATFCRHPSFGSARSLRFRP